MARRSRKWDTHWNNENKIRIIYGLRFEVRDEFKYNIHTHDQSAHGILYEYEIESNWEIFVWCVFVVVGGGFFFALVNIVDIYGVLIHSCWILLVEFLNSSFRWTRWFGSVRSRSFWWINENGVYESVCAVRMIWFSLPYIVFHFINLVGVLVEPNTLFYSRLDKQSTWNQRRIDKKVIIYVLVAYLFIENVVQWSIFMLFDFGFIDRSMITSFRIEAKANKRSLRSREDNMKWER